MCGLGYQITRAHRRPRQSSVCCTRLNPRSKADKRRVVPHLSSLEVDRVRRARACDNPTNERARTESWGGNCQQRQSRRCIAGCDGRCALPDSWGLASRCHQPGGHGCLRDGHGSAVSSLHAVSRLAYGPRKARLSEARPRSDLLTHCRQLPTIHPRRCSWLVGSRIPRASYSSCWILGCATRMPCGTASS